MPCNNTVFDAQERAIEAQERSELRAMLCGVMTILEDSGTYEPFDEAFGKDFPADECGISAQAVLDWWNLHKQMDGERRKRERAELHKKKAREAAKAKLTKRERKLLGIE